MRQFRIEVEIHASPERVWAVLSDIERWSEWTPSITSIRRLDKGPLAVGSRAHIRQPKLRPADWQITELDTGRSFTWIMRAPGVQVTGRHDIETNGNGSRVTLSTQFSGFLGPLVALLTRSLNERYIALEAQGLKARSESVTA